MSAVAAITFDLENVDNIRLANVCGPLDEHIHLIEKRLGVEINRQGGRFEVQGNASLLQSVANLIDDLYGLSEKEVIDSNSVHLMLKGMDDESSLSAKNEYVDPQMFSVKLQKCSIRGRGGRQVKYLKNIKEYDISFGIGPAGTGKTYLAVAAAVEALEQDKVSRIILVRPAVEAGERLGFLPGDLAQKIDPYLRPMYDALFEMMGNQKVAKLMERNVIEIAPLAYMRGRTLNDAFIILDEAQNTTKEQMKMFLTRIGFGSTAVVTGDISQVDLPNGCYSGLRHAMEILDGVDDIGFVSFENRDVVRHPLVQKVVEAYDAFDLKQSSANKSSSSQSS